MGMNYSQNVCMSHMIVIRSIKAFMTLLVLERDKATNKWDSFVNSNLNIIWILKFVVNSAHQDSTQLKGSWPFQSHKLFEVFTPISFSTTFIEIQKGVNK